MSGVEKGPDAFRTISEAAAELGVPSHVLRFWETKFSFIRPMKRAGGRRFYRPRDLDVLKGVRTLLHEEGYTIKGVQRLHKEEGVRRLLAAAGTAPEDGADASSFGVEAAGDDMGSPTDASAAAASPAEEVFVEPARPVVAAAARARLIGVLDDLQNAKAAVDRLLQGSAKS